MKNMKNMKIIGGAPARRQSAFILPVAMLRDAGVKEGSPPIRAVNRDQAGTHIAYSGGRRLP